MTTSQQIPVWKKNPFIRIVLVYIAGILLQRYCNVSGWCILFLIAIVSLSLVVISKGSVSWLFRYQMLQGLLLNAWMVLAAMAVVWLSDLRNNSNWFYHRYEKDDCLVLQLINEPTGQSGHYKATANVLALIKEGRAIASVGKMQIYFGNNDLFHSLHYGSSLVVSAVPKTIVSKANPGGFDYKQYAANKQLFHSLQIKENWRLLHADGGSSLMRMVLKTREAILNLLKENFANHKKELGIAEALLIGYANDVDKDLQQAYSNTGVVHIIAISGMHLALIYVLLVFIFSKLPYIKNHAWLQLFFVLSILWFFSLLTGASASVCRAALMFTFISVGKHFNRTANVYNALAASALMLLVYDSGNLFDVGFQLSYLAVLSIVIFQKNIQAWFHFQNKWLQKVWELAAVSLSAQILTFPICIYYFHQFPNLFLVANMLAVPLSSVILYCLMSMVLLYKWALVAGCITKITVFLIACLNQIILFIDEVPLGTWKNISSNLLSTILLYVLIVSVSVWLFAKSKYWFFCMLSCSLVFVLYHSIQRVFSIKQQQLIIYQSPSHQIIEYIRGNAYAGLIDNKPIGNENKNLIKKYIDPANCFYRVDKLSAHLIQQPLDGILLYNFGNIRALVVDSSASYLPLKNKIKIDLLIVSKNVRPNFKTLLNTFEIGAVVFDATNTMWKIDKWEKECDALHLPHHNVIKNGAFVKGLSHF